MDDRTKKMVAQLDDEARGVRENTLESLYASGHKFRDLVADYEDAKARAEELEPKLAEYKTANEAARRRNAELRAALWVKVNWKISSAIAAGLLVVGVCGWAYEHYWSYSEAVMAGLRASVASASWGEGWSDPLASRVGGEPWWLMFYGDIDASSFSDSRGNPIEMRCLHVYAVPAEPYAPGQFMKPSPRNFLGWVSWPELAMHCKPSPNQRADNK
jgi:hypothetical protein